MKKGIKLFAAAILFGSSMATTTIVANTDNDLNQVTTVNAMGRQRRIRKAVKIIQKSYGDEADVYYDSENKCIAICPTDEEFTDEVMDVMDGVESTDDWDELADGLDSLSDSIHDDAHLNLPVALVNPQNPDRVLYGSYNGVQVYNVMEDNSDD